MLIRLGKQTFYLWRFIRKVSARLLLLLLGTAASLAVGEAYLRWSEPAPERAVFEFHRAWGESTRRNSFSFRDVEHKTGKRPGCRRVLFLGDSYTEAVGVKDREMFSSRFMTRWQKVIPGAQAEVINMGRGGWSTVQEVEFYRQHGRQFVPDVLVLGFVLNDPEVEWYTPDCIINPVWDMWLENRSYLFSFIKKKVLALKAKWGATPDMAAYVKMLYADGYPGWLRCQGAMAELAEICRQDGTIPVVVIFPIYDQWDEYVEIHAKIRQAAEAQGILTLDLLPVFAATRREPRSFWVHAEDGHPNAEAHDIIATEVLSFLLAQDTTAQRLRP